MICDVEEEESLLLKTEDEEEDADILYIRLLNYDEIWILIVLNLESLFNFSNTRFSAQMESNF